VPGEPLTTDSDEVNRHGLFFDPELVRHKKKLRSPRRMDNDAAGAAENKFVAMSTNSITRCGRTGSAR
jgi:hypothetical protein